MIVDHRTYTIRHGQANTYIDLFEKEGLPVQIKHLGKPIAYFETTIGPLNQVIHLWSYESLADMEKRRAQRDADPAWTEYKKKSGGMLEAQENQIVKPTSFSPLK